MVIDPALEIPEIESYNGIATRSPVNTTYHLPAIHSSKTMENQIGNACGVILMGSAASVHDSLDWIKDTRAIIQKAVDKKIPILGICFGHQFLAHFFGGTVDYLWDTVKRRGVRKVQILENNLLNNDQEGDLIYSHQEGVTTCPPDFDVSARSSMVEIEAIVHKSLPI
jgi:GMP synthase (glutamine-hydrolysing)